MGSLITSVFRLDLRRFRFDVHRVGWLAPYCPVLLESSTCLFWRMSAAFDSNHALANSAAMSLCLASLLTIYLRFACLGALSKNQRVLETWGHREGFSKTKSSGSGKSLRDCPKTGWSVLGLRSESAFKSRSSATHRRIPRSIFRRWIESEPTSDRLEVGHQREESRRGKRRDSASMERTAREPKWHPSRIYLCKMAEARPITQYESSQLWAS